MSDRLSPIESIIWRVGYDPDLRMTIGNLMILDHAPSPADLTDRLVALSKDAPQLRARPSESLLPGLRYCWATDPDFDASLHLRRATVPAPGELRHVLDLLGLIEPLPFEPDRSPWDATLIEGLAHGRAALYLRAHHVLTDGMGGAAIVNQIFDEARPQPAKAKTTGKELPGRAAEETNRDPQAGRDRRSLTVTIDFNLFNRAVQPLASSLNAARITEPADALVRGLQLGLDVASSVSRQALVYGGTLATWPDA